MSKGQGGFTIVEMLIATIILTVGLLGLVGTSSLVTRMIGRGQRSAAAATFAMRRMERLRPAACITTQRQAGADTLLRGSAWVAINQWSYTDVGADTYRVRVVTTSKTVRNRFRVDTMETAVSCAD